MLEIELTDQHLATLTQALRVARNHKVDCEAAMRRCAVTGGNAMISVEAARAMEAQHRLDGVEYDKLLKILENASSVWVQEEDRFE